jgi:ubiquinone/menaquinone biosynthesis C-methylase UbiE
VRFVLREGAFFVLAGKSRSDWVVNALKAGTVKVRLGNLVIQTVVSEASPEERTDAIDEFAKKYGSRVVRDWYSNVDLALRLVPEGEPTVRDAVKGESQVASTYEDWRSQKKAYYQSVSEAFDSASEEYDFTIGHNYINTWIRKRSVSELLSLVKKNDTLVEIGCGTGAEALDVSPYVARIIATDISDQMIEIVRKKIQAKRAFDKITPIKLRAAEVDQVKKILDGAEADSAYSFNGALNCEPDLEDFVEGLASVLTSGGYFVCSVRNSLCLGEVLSHAAALQFEKMAPRKKQPIMVSVGGLDIPALYYPPSVFARFFRTRFKLLRVIGLPAFLPPAYLSDYYVKFKEVGYVLERLENTLGNRFPFNRLGDQTLFVFQNR